MAAMFTATNGPLARGLSRCAARANSSLPVPGSPASRIGSVVRAARSRSRNRASTAGSRVTMPTSAHRRRRRSCSASPGTPVRPVGGAQLALERLQPQTRLLFLGGGGRELAPQRIGRVEQPALGAGRARDGGPRRLEILLEVSTVDSCRTRCSRMPATSPSSRRRRRAAPTWFHTSAPTPASVSAANGWTIGSATPSRTAPIDTSDARAIRQEHEARHAMPTPDARPSHAATIATTSVPPQRHSGGASTQPRAGQRGIEQLDLDPDIGQRADGRASHRRSADR